MSGVCPRRPVAGKEVEPCSYPLFVGTPWGS
jgi:hypothetical protein